MRETHWAISSIRLCVVCVCVCYLGSSVCPDNALHTGNAWTGSYRTEASAKQRNTFAEENKDCVFAIFLYRKKNNFSLFRLS